jgi:hypothetical protein
MTIEKIIAMTYAFEGNVQTSAVMPGGKEKEKGKREKGEGRRTHRQHLGYQTNTENKFERSSSELVINPNLTSKCGSHFMPGELLNF